MRLLFNKNLLVILLLSGSIFSNNTLQAQTKSEIINSSYFVAFGRYATSAEMKYWLQAVGNKSIPEMVANHQSYLASDQKEREQTIRRSYMDAFGWPPTQAETNYWSGQKKNYAQMMQNHINTWLATQKDKRQLVISQSYYKVFNRAASTQETDYWMKQPIYSFVQLIAMHSTWKSKNTASANKTIIDPKLNTGVISTDALSAQAAAGIRAAGGSNVIAPGGGNVIAASAGNVVSAGGLN